MWREEAVLGMRSSRAVSGTGSRDPGGPSFLALLGPTASGKTALSLALAKRMEVEIISMDSRQIYRGMDVGTGKVPPEERARIPHYGLDLREPDESYSAGQFSRDARGWISEIRGRGRVPLLVGGTGFFLRALTHPMFSEPPLDRARLKALRRFLNGLSWSTLQRFVSTLDPRREEVAARGGRQRATRTVEMALMTGRPLSWWQDQVVATEVPLRGVVVVLDLPREILYQRINRRVEAMLREGLVEEVAGLLASGFGPEDPGMTGAGYREVTEYLGGTLSLEEATERIRQAHRQYARRQMTWNRHQLLPGTVFLDGTLPERDLVDRVLRVWNESVGRGRGQGKSSEPAKEEGMEDERS
jgi:tRNA dimethylallyltransferase